MTQVCWDVDPQLELEHDENSAQDLETIQGSTETPRAVEEDNQSETSEDINFSLPLSSDLSGEEIFSPETLEEEIVGSQEQSSSDTWTDKTFWSNIDIESLTKSPKTPEQP